MAQGDVKGTLTYANANVLSSQSATGSVSVSIGDVIVVGYSQTGGGGGSASGISDNLGNSYDPVDAQIGDSGVNLRTWYSIATVSGTLTSITFTASSNSADLDILAAVFEGPYLELRGFTSDTSADTSSPFILNNSVGGAEVGDLIVSDSAANHSTVWSAVSPTLLAGNHNFSSTIKQAIGYRIHDGSGSGDDISFSAGSNPGVHIYFKLAFIPLLSPPAANRVFSRFAPTVTVSAHHVREPASANRVLSTFAPTLLYARIISPATYNLTLQKHTPDVLAAGENVKQPATAERFLSTTAPLVGIPLLPAQGNLLLSTFAPTVQVRADHTREPASANLTLSSVAPSLLLSSSLHLTCSATLAAAPITGYIQLVTNEDAQLVYAAEISLWGRHDRID